MEVDRAVRAAAQALLTHLLCGKQLCPTSRGRGGESALQSVMGAASGHPCGCRDKMDWDLLQREMLSSGVVLACGTVSCLSLLPGQVPPDLAEGREGLFS